jgi:hypothetical protein
VQELEIGVVPDDFLSPTGKIRQGSTPRARPLALTQAMTVERRLTVSGVMRIPATDGEPTAEYQ